MKLSPFRRTITLWRGSALLKASAGAPESDNMFIGTSVLPVSFLCCCDATVGGVVEINLKMDEPSPCLNTTSGCCTECIVE
jgi:hypothetical protein